MSAGVCFWGEDGEKRPRLFSYAGRICLIGVEK
ncbi:hypothetical protein Maut_00741 [Moorella thermoacetica]|uniref:Uncharacterized protein n=2 Tax=Neomoorella thermoacetica TaxID=1525 RepID=A0AAC9MT87_NEOTH|nr:hypothetical protein Maut_00741 [Moorella thermoacetica]OIQ53642.1 hypothetical protein MORE_19960 [Moorella thermoacetica]GAF26266.1 hypothetical protein MTY_1605 [Moorella thermoacetica Y72]